MLESRSKLQRWRTLPHLSRSSGSATYFRLRQWSDDGCLFGKIDRKRLYIQFSGHWYLFLLFFVKLVLIGSPSQSRGQVILWASTCEDWHQEFQTIFNHWSSIDHIRHFLTLDVTISMSLLNISSSDEHLKYHGGYYLLTILTGSNTCDLFNVIFNWHIINISLLDAGFHNFESSHIW